MALVMHEGPLRRPRFFEPEVELFLPYRPPLDWQSLLDYYRAHQIGGVETVDNLGYERLFIEDGEVGCLRVTNDDVKLPQLKLKINGIKAATLPAIVQRVRRMFDLEMDPSLVEAAFRRQAGFGQLWDKSPGLRVAKGWSPFETAIATILGQVVSVARGKALIAQLVEHYGEESSHPLTRDLIRLFPRPETLATASMTGIGTTEARRQSIRALSLALANGTIDLLSPGPEEEIRKHLMAIKGIGYGRPNTSLSALSEIPTPFLTPICY